MKTKKRTNEITYVHIMSPSSASKAWYMPYNLYRWKRVVLEWIIDGTVEFLESIYNVIFQCNSDFYKPIIGASRMPFPAISIRDEETGEYNIQNIQTMINLIMMGIERSWFVVSHFKNVEQGFHYITSGNTDYIVYSAQTHHVTDWARQITFAFDVYNDFHATEKPEQIALQSAVHSHVEGDIFHRVQGDESPNIKDILPINIMEEYEKIIREWKHTELQLKKKKAVPAEGI